MGFLIWKGEHFREKLRREVLSDWGGTERARCRGEKREIPADHEWKGNSRAGISFGFSL